MNNAIFSKLAYKMNSTNSLADRINDINKNLVNTGYEIIPDKSNKNTSYFINHDKKKIVIADRGSQFLSNKGKNDFANDILYTLGLEKHAPQFKKRTNKVIKNIKNSPNDYKIDLTGHSYGAASIHNTLLNNKKILKQIDRIDLYNPLISPFNKKISKPHKKLLDEKLHIHRTEADVPSSLYHNIDYGNLNVYKQKENATKIKLPSHLENVFNTVEQLKAHTIDNFL